MTLITNSHDDDHDFANLHKCRECDGPVPYPFLYWYGMPIRLCAECLQDNQTGIKELLETNQMREKGET
jgi:hypothetical protein